MIGIVGGIQDVMRAMDKKSKAIDQAVARGVTRGAIIVQGAARSKIMKGGRSGNIYSRGKWGHVASAAGEAPANDTGNLQRSIRVVAAKPGPTATAYVQVAADYGEALEFGAKHGNHYMEPRPFLQPAMDENAKQINEIILQSIAEAVKA